MLHVFVLLILELIVFEYIIFHRKSGAICYNAAIHINIIANRVFGLHNMYLNAPCLIGSF